MWGMTRGNPFSFPPLADVYTAEKRPSALSLSKESGSNATLASPGIHASSRINRGQEDR